MGHNLHGVSEVVGASPVGIDAGIQMAISRASTSLRGLDWFEVTETHGDTANGRSTHRQVGL